MCMLRHRNRAATKTAVAAAAKTAPTPGKDWRTKGQQSDERRRDETGEKPIGHRKVRHVMREDFAARTIR
jgi:hypothetical protein